MPKRSRESGESPNLVDRVKVPPIIDIEDFDEVINILCHGDPGAGKNRLWGHLPRMLILAIEEGTVSIKKAGIKGAKVMRCRSWSDIVGAYQYLLEHADEYDWIMIDSITKAQALCLRHIMNMVVAANPARDPHIPAQGDHFKWQLTIKQMVMDFNELPVNTIWLARSRNAENPDGDDIIVPAIEGKDYGISAWVCGEMSLVCYLKKEVKDKKTVRKLYTNDHAVYWTKDWFDVLPHVISFTSEVGVAAKIVAMLQASGEPEETQAVKPARKKATKKVASTKKKR